MEIKRRLMAYNTTPIWASAGASRRQWKMTNKKTAKIERKRKKRDQNEEMIISDVIFALFKN
jgi:ribosomal protein L12E/L44/L45/RPP1/RPP2